MKPSALCAIVLCASLAASDEPDRKGQTIANRFESGDEGWHVYDYNGGSGIQDVFKPVTWEKAGGVKNGGYIWGDDSRWRIDTPEKPHSILALIHYRRWVKSPPVDVRDAEVSVCLRGDKLDLKGAKCYFWVNRPGTRWHLTSQPLKITEGDWGEKLTFTLKNDEKLWHRSWAANPAPLKDILQTCHSYGFAFVGFSEKVTGKFAMDEFVIRLAPQLKVEDKEKK
jgi:hypothetical protein